MSSTTHLAARPRRSRCQVAGHASTASSLRRRYTAASTRSWSRRAKATVLFVAIKARDDEVGDELIDREVGFLQLLDGHLNRGPVDRFGNRRWRRYCATGWIPGADVRVVASELREQGSPTQRLELCCRLARAYGALHSCGVLHGRVHPRHVLVDVDGAWVWSTSRSRQPRGRARRGPARRALQLPERPRTGCAVLLARIRRSPRPRSSTRSPRCSSS